ncbi:6374_t:CDS:1 [Paraglomus occultum]|uniref:6374_t:CDS:1 n=1 Tax=Paraglomus occultum TaxID=144539 RepID=A0A9N8Z6X1_9GLOM|nr:6374_t:CDS:1 [Paraglomus occultum]
MDSLRIETNPQTCLAYRINNCDQMKFIQYQYNSKKKARQQAKTMRSRSRPKPVFFQYRRWVQKQLQSHYGKVSMPTVSTIASIWWKQMPINQKWDIEQLLSTLKSELNDDQTEDLGNDEESSSPEEIEVMLSWIEREWNGQFKPNN